MSTERASPKAVIASPDRLTPNLKAKSRARRERQRTLAGIADHAPKRRNDLLPRLAVSYVPIDELRQAPRRVRRENASRRGNREPTGNPRGRPTLTESAVG
jgi:hypothetical protein